MVVKLKVVNPAESNLTSGLLIGESMITDGHVETSGAHTTVSALSALQLKTVSSSQLRLTGG